MFTTARILMPVIGLIACSPDDDAGDLGQASRGPAPEILWETYTFDEVEDDVVCSGALNPTAVIGGVYLAQTHVMEPEWPFFYLIAGRPALVEVVVTGEGSAPEVAVAAFADGVSLGSLCLDGPATLPAEVDLTTHQRADRFTVTLPSEWLVPGLSLDITADVDSREFDAETLGVEHAPEVSLVMIEMDVVNYNDGLPDVEPPAEFLEEFAAAMPAMKTHFATLPTRMSLPELVVGGYAQPEGDPPLVITQRLCSSDEDPDTDDCMVSDEIEDWDINAAASRYVNAFHVANGDFVGRFYYGNTENLFPGGWGGGRNFVSADFQWVTIHEMGHAASLPHWSDVFAPAKPDDGSYEYPWGGVDFDGGGRGPTWSYAQHLGEYISPICQDPYSDNFGLERSDAMQRNRSCSEWRSDGAGPWDGFSDFSAYSMFRFITGSEFNQRGWVSDPTWGEVEYNLPAREGYPISRWDDEGMPEIVWEHPTLSQPQWQTYDFMVPAEWDRPVYTILGTYHPEASEVILLADVMYHQGNLPTLLDPTDPEIFEALKAGEDGPYGDHFWWPHDLTFRLIYEDGTVLHVLYPHNSTTRDWEPGVGPWRWDLTYFAINVPADSTLLQIELFERPMAVQYSDWTYEGNIANPDLGITAENFLDDAVRVLHERF